MFVKGMFGSQFSRILIYISYMKHSNNTFVGLDKFLW